MKSIVASAVVGFVTLKAVQLDNPDRLVVEDIEDTPAVGRCLSTPCRVEANEDDESFDYYIGQTLTRRVFLEGGFQKFDEKGRLHSTNGPAVGYPDGTVEYYRHGERYSSSYFTDSVSRSSGYVQ